MNEIIQPIFLLKTGNECYLTTIYNHLFNCGSPISESDIFFLGDGMDFSYQWSDNTNKFEEIRIFHDSERYIFNFFNKIRVPIDKKKLSYNYSEFSEQIKEKLDNRLSVILCTNSKYLNYNKIQNNRGRLHVVSLHEYNNDSVKISDCYVPIPNNIITYYGDYSLRELFKASGMAFDHKNTVFTFKCNEAVTNLKKLKQETIFESFNNNMLQYYNNCFDSLFQFCNKIKDMNYIFF